MREGFPAESWVREFPSFEGGFPSLDGEFPELPGALWEGVLPEVGVVLRRSAMTLLVIFGGLTDRIGFGWEACLQGRKEYKYSKNSRHKYHRACAQLLAFLGSTFSDLSTLNPFLHEYSC